MVYSVLTQVSKQKLKIVPDQSSKLLAENDLEERSFVLDVTNQSNLFASFQVELLAEGIDPNSALKWYEIEPEICAKKPPGDRTQFKVQLTRAPIPAYNTEIKIVAKILSVESEQLSATQTLQLQIEQPQKPLKVELPFKDLRVYPGDQLEIPVVVYNLSSKYTEITLELPEPEPIRIRDEKNLSINRKSKNSKTEPTWIKDNKQTIVKLGAGSSAQVSFSVSPPPNAIHQIYNFTVEATQGNNSDSTQGRLEVMPSGIVEVTCDQSTQTIPTHPFWKLGQRSHFAQFPLQFDNQTNQVQEVEVSCQTKDQLTQWQYNNQIKVEPNAKAAELLEVERPRPWLGWKRKAVLQLETTLTNPVSGKPNDAVQIRPSTQLLELFVRPRIPVFVQAGALLLAGLGSLILIALQSLTPAQHNAPITSIRISGDTVFSASNDKTVRRWKFNNTLLRFLPWQSEVPLSPDGEIAGDMFSGKGIRVIRVLPNQSEKIAVGKEDGEIELWTMPPYPKYPERIKSLSQGSDRVFDLAYNEDQLLFSGHGGGKVKVWNLQSLQLQQSSDDFNAPISALAVDSQGKSVLIGGGYNRLERWDWTINKPKEITYSWKGNNTAIFTRNHYITSITIAQKKAITADNAGYITAWDLDKSPPEMIAQENKDHRSVRAVAISENGCYVASAGNDKRLRLYTLNQGKLNLKREVGEGIRTVDIHQVDNSHILIASDAPDNTVKLYRVEVNSHDCQ